MSFRVKRDRYGNSTRHEFGKFEDVCIRRILRVGPIEGKDGAPVMINDSLIVSGDVIISGGLEVMGISTFCDTVQVDSLEPKTGSTININGSICANEISTDTLSAKTGSTICIDSNISVDKIVSKTEKVIIDDSLCITGNLIVDGETNLSIVPEFDTLKVNGTADFCDDVSLDTLKGLTDGTILVDADLCVSGDVKLDKLIPKTSSTIELDGGLCVTEDLLVDQIYAKPGGDEVIHLQDWMMASATATFCSTVQVDKIEGKSSGTVTIDDNLCINKDTYLTSIYPKPGENNTIVFNGATLTQSTAAFCGKVKVDTITGKSEASVEIEGNLCVSNIYTDNIYAKIENSVLIKDQFFADATAIFCSDVLIDKIQGKSSGTVCIESNLKVDGLILISETINAVEDGVITVPPHKTLVEGDGILSGRTQWATRIAETGLPATNELGTDTSIDQNGDVIVFGKYSGATVMIFNADNTSAGTLSTSGFVDGVISKYDCKGQNEWFAQIANISSNNRNGGVAIKEDVAVIASYSGPVVTLFNEDGSVGSTETKSGTSNGVVAKYNSIGNVQWSAKIEATTVSANKISMNDQNIVAVGCSTGTLTIFNANGSTVGTITSASGEEAFVVNYNCNGSVKWFTWLESGNIDVADVDIDVNGNVAITGQSQESFIIYNADNTIFQMYSGNRTSFTIYYDSDGFGMWISTTSNHNTIRGSRVSMNKNDVISIGEYNGGDNDPLIIFNANGSTGATLPPSDFVRNIFIVKYSCEGVVQWATRVAGASATNGEGVSINEHGEIIVTGTYTSNPTTIYNANGTVGTTLDIDGISAVFVAKFDTDGQLVWASRVDGTGDDKARGIDINDNGDILVTGIYESDPLEIYDADGSSALTLQYSGGTDAFIVKYSDFINMNLIDGTFSGTSKVIYSDDGNINVRGNLKGPDGEDKSKLFLRDGQSADLCWSSKNGKWIIGPNTGNFA